MGDLTLVAKPNPFDGESYCAQVAAGQTIAQMLGEGRTNACSVTIDGHDVPQTLWATVKPKAGKTVHVVLYPQGGSGGKWARLALTVVLMYFTYGASGWASAASTAWGGSAAVWGAGIMLAGTLAINALIPPPMAKGLSAGNPFQQVLSLTGTSNQLNQYGVIPCVVGTMTDYFPPHAAMPYTEISGDDQYLRMLLDLGEGDDLDVSDIRIGETSIDTFDDVEYEVTRTPTLFTQDVYEQQLAITLDPSTAYTQTTQDAVSEISIDIVAPQGLFAITSKGDFVAAWQFMVIEFAVAGSGTWYGVTAPTEGITPSSSALTEIGTAQWQIKSSANKALRVGLRWKVPGSHAWDVRITMGTPGWASSVQQSNTLVWSALRSISPKLPSNTGTTKLAVRIKATNQLQGVVQNLKCRVAQKIPVYDQAAGTWSAPVESQNAGDIFRWLLLYCPAVLRRLTEDRLDMAGISAWADECTAKGYRTSFVMDSGRAFGDVLNDVLASGRATKGKRNGKYSAIRDIPQTVPVQMFTPRNSSGFTVARTFADLPQGLRVTFTNPEASSQQDVILVFIDGYNETNATLYDTLDLSMVVDPVTAWKLGRYHLAVAWNRPNQYTFTADAEAIVCERGDLITVAHDIIQSGVTAARVKSVANGRVVLDTWVDYDSTKTYQLRVRRGSDGSQGLLNTGGVLTWDSTLITFDSSMGWDSASGPTQVFTYDASFVIAAGDLAEVVIVGSDVVPLIVKSIKAGDNLSATITCVDAAPEVWSADAGTPPVFVSSITGKSWCAAPDPPVLSVRVGTTAVDNAGLSGNESGFSGARSPGLYRLPSYKQQSLRRLEEAM